MHRATYTAYKAKTGLVVAVEADLKMINPCGIIAVKPVEYPNSNCKRAMQLIGWIISDERLRAIAGFGVGGKAAFFPSAIPGT